MQEEAGQRTPRADLLMVAPPGPRTCGKRESIGFGQPSHFGGGGDRSRRSRDAMSNVMTASEHRTPPDASYRSFERFIKAGSPCFVTVRRFLIDRATLPSLQQGP
jgi:hypothetical protein